MMRRLFVAATLATALSLCACGPPYGADFGFPEPPPRAAGVTEVLSDRGSDNDDPLRSVISVVDPNELSPEDFARFYRNTFPPEAGWTAGQSRPGQILCLANRANKKYVELVEAFSYTGTRVPRKPDRLLLVKTRFASVAPSEQCGLTLAWVPIDLVE